MSLAYLLLCHRMPAAVVDLVHMLHRPETTIVLHVDAKAAPALHATAAHLAAALPGVHVLPAVLCSWGGWSLVAVTRRGIAAALTLNADWTHLLPLSEGHLPLCEPAQAAASLPRGESCIDAAPVTSLAEAARADVLHRFAATYRELPGVGMFPVAPRTLPDTVLASLHHGSQWLALAREACERLGAVPEDAWAPFRTSLIADETALPSILLGTEFGRGLRVQRRATTFVAWPHLSGMSDWTFSQANFFAARDAGHLFIRKRPAELPAAVAQAVAPFARTMLQNLPEPADAFARGAAVSALAAVLQTALAPRFPGVVAEVFVPVRAGGSPSCFLNLRWPRLPATLRVALLSEDFATFKGVLAWGGQPEDDPRLRTLGGNPTWLMKARLWELFLMREVLLPNLPDAGFVTLAPREGPGRLAALLAHLLQAGFALTE